jgi:signal transduction histidine kinase
VLTSLKRPNLARLGPLLFVLSGWLFGYFLLHDGAVSGAQRLFELYRAGQREALPLFYSAPAGQIAPPSAYQMRLICADQPAGARLAPLLDAAAPALSVDCEQANGIFIGYATQSVQLQANGVPLERITLRPGADDVGFRQAFLFLLPPKLLHAGGNSVELLLQPNTARMALGEVWFGPRARLETHFRGIHASRVTATQITAITAGLSMLFAALLYLQRRRETLYGWFAAGVALWMVYLTHFLWYGAPLAGHCWLALIHMALAGSLLCLQQFCREFLEQPRTRLDRALAWLALAGSVLMMLVSVIAPESALYGVFLNIVLRGVLLLLGLTLTGTLILAAMRGGQMQVYWLAAAAVLGLSGGVFDSAVVLGLLRSNTLLFHLGILPLVVVFSTILLRRFVNLLEATEAQNADLDRRMQQSTAALERAFAARQLLERERVLVDERHRLATDLHDGAGSQLVSLLAAVRREGITQAQMEQALLETIADLRLVMDSMDSMGNDLAQALGQFRSRMEPRLRAAGLTSVWRTASLRDGLKLSPRRTLNIFRMLQESLVNVLKHANASTVHISARDASSVLELSVCDDGDGLPAELLEASNRAKLGGRGLSNVDSRMKSLGGYARFSANAAISAAADANAPSKPGLDVRLYVPIPPENETQW